MKKTRIAYFMDGGETTGGINEYLKLVLGNLDPASFHTIGIFLGPGDAVDDLGHCFDEVAFLTGRRLVNSGASNNKVRKSFDLLSKATLAISAVRLLAHSLRVNRVDVVDVNYYPHHLIAGVASRLAGRPCIWHWHSAKHISGLKRVMLHFAISRLSHKVIACSHFAQRTIGRANDSKIITLHNPLDHVRLKKEQKAGFLRSKIPGGQMCPVIAMIGTISMLKGQIVFVEAAAKVLQRAPEAKFLIIGAETHAHAARFKLEKNLKAMICERGIVNSVLLLGEIKNAAHYLIDCTVVCIPTVPRGNVLGEAFPYSTIQAMAAGVPVIIHNIGGFNEVVEHRKNGLVTDCSDSNLLAAAILEYLSSLEFRNRMAACAQRTIQEKFEIRTYMQTLERIYTETLPTN